MKKFLTVGYLVSAFAITAATSKATDHPNSGGVGSSYWVSSNCTGAIPSAGIYTSGSEIKDAWDSNSRSFEAPPDFRHFGMPVERMYVGTPVVAGAGTSQHTCAVNQQYPYTTEQGSTRMVTIYECILPTNERCAVSFEKFPSSTSLSGQPTHH